MKKQESEINPREEIKMAELIKDRLEKLRKNMQEEKIDAYLVLSSDFHGSEYVGDYFKCREYISGFTGSAGTVLILMDEAGLWTDGRYFLQAKQELTGSGITLFRMDEDDVPSLEKYLTEKMPGGGCLGVDGRTISVDYFRRLEKSLNEKNAAIRLDCDLIGNLWQDRPKMSCEAAWELDISYAGRPRAEKISEIKKSITEKKADAAVISSLDDIAWTLNIRGNDVSCTPVVLSYLVIQEEKICWFVQRHAVDKLLEETLKKDGISIYDYEQFFDFLSEELNCRQVYLDPDRTSMAVYRRVQKADDFSKTKILEGKSIPLLLKAVKNSTEIQNMKKAHIKDAVACIKFIYWLKSNMKKKNSAEYGSSQNAGKNQPDMITELSAAKKLEEFRKAQAHYLEPSFEPIVGYAHHGAIVHYSAAADTDIELKPEGFVLVDSGGHYLEGTTDITRTISLGELTLEQKHNYTLVLKGNIRLGAAIFKYGYAGAQLDCLAREALWQNGLDYNHGTGHGVGYLLSVHEPPNSIRSKITEGDECVRLEEGMIVSNEPGLYLAGKYGVRIENLIVCTEVNKNEYGRFMGFETLTLVPFEREAIIVEKLDENERKLVNEYHAKIYEIISPYLEDKEREWLQTVTAEL